MAKKKGARSSDRMDPTHNKSLAIRTVLEQLPNGKAADVAESVKSQFGHDVSKNMIYMIKTKLNMASDGRVKRGPKKAGNGNAALSSAASWVDAIKLARQLLQAAGDLPNATALLKALADK